MSYIMDTLLGAATKTTGYRPSDDSTAVLFGVQPTSASGQNINQETALNISAVWCAINLIANAVKSLPWFTYRRLVVGKKPARDEQVYELLHDKPNSETTPSRFKRLLTSWALQWGNGRAEIERDRRLRPIALWPIHPSRARTYRDKAGRIVHEVWNEDGSRVILADEDVFHTMGFSKDGISGISVIGQARESLGLSVAAEAYGARFFGNNARPSVILEYPNAFGTDDEDKVKALRKSWQETMGGENIHGTVILEDGMTAKVLSMPNEDAQFLETRTFQIVEVARWFNIPPHKLKELSHATFSNIEHLAIEYVGDAILPWVIDMEEEADRKLLVPGGDLFTEFLMDGLLRTDAETRNKALAIKRQWGITSADEWRALDNENPQPDGQGEVYIVPKNYAPATEFTEEGRVELQPPPPPPGPIPEPPPQPEPAPQGGALRKAIAEAHHPIFADVIGRMDRKQQAAIKRAAKKPESFEAWQEQFYVDHATTIRAALIPCVEALGGALRATLPSPIPDAEWDEFTGRFTKGAVEKLVTAFRTGCASDTFASEMIFLFVKCMSSAFKGGSNE